MHVPAVLPAEDSGDRIVGRSTVMQEMCKSLGRIAPQDVNVLILGESGTGKELVARRCISTAARSSRSWPSTAPPFRRRCWKVNYSDMKKGRSPARIASASANSSRQQWHAVPR